MQRVTSYGSVSVSLSVQHKPVHRIEPTKRYWHGSFFRPAYTALLGNSSIFKNEGTCIGLPVSGIANFVTARQLSQSVVNLLDMHVQVNA